MRIYYSLSFPLPVEKDAKDYDLLAINLWKGKGYTSPQGEPTAFRPPLYPLFLCFCYHLFGHRFLPVRIIQSLLGIATCWGIYLLGRKWKGEKVGLLSLAFSSLYPPFIYFYYAPRGILSETLYLFLLIFSLYFLVLEEKKPLHIQRNLILSGIFLGLATLTRSVSLLLLFIYALYLFLKEGKSKHLVRKLTCLTLSFLFILFPWMVRNAVVFSHLVPVSTNGGHTLYASNHPSSDGLGGEVYCRIVLPMDRELKKKGLNEAERSSYFFREGLKFIWQNPGRSLKLFLKKFLLFWDFSQENYLGGRRYLTYNFSYAFFLPFALVGIYAGFKSTNRYLTLLWLMLIIYFSLFHSLVHTCTRYRISIEPFLLIFSAGGIIYLWENFKKKFIFYGILAGLLFLNTWVYFHYLLVLRIIKGYFRVAFG